MLTVTLTHQQLLALQQAAGIAQTQLVAGKHKYAKINQAQLQAGIQALQAVYISNIKL